MQIGATIKDVFSFSVNNFNPDGFKSVTLRSVGLKVSVTLSIKERWCKQRSPCVTMIINVQVLRFYFLSGSQSVVFTFYLRSGNAHTSVNRKVS